MNGKQSFIEVASSMGQLSLVIATGYRQGGSDEEANLQFARAARYGHVVS